MGLLNSAASDTNKLRHEPLKSAIGWFEQAQNCDNDKKRKQSYQEDARREFMKAISLEDDENKIAAFVGLSMCQRLLGDEKNARLNMQKIQGIELTKGAIIRATAKYLLVPPFLRAAVIARATMKRNESFDAFKKKATKFNTKLMALPR